MPRRIIAPSVAFALAIAARPDTGTAQAAPVPPPPRRAADTAFAAVQARGADPRAMGVDQYTSVHRFDARPDGGRIALQQRGADAASVATIRAHLRQVAAAFAAGDFRTPAFVHGRDVPGTTVMAAKRTAIAYRYRDLPDGGEVRITTRDAAALRAVHAFVAFQRADHRASGSGDPHAGHGAHGQAHQGHAHQPPA